MMPMLIHGGPDMLGVPLHDLSTNSNACGPYAPAEQALREADARHYPDLTYTELTIQLAAWHGVAPARIVIGASGSELIQRMSTAVAVQAMASGAGVPASVWLPKHAYGDYARAAHAVGLSRTSVAQVANLIWACDPSSPLGQADDGLVDRVANLKPGQTLVLDQAYEPLRLEGELTLDSAAFDRIWRFVTPNKSLGLTGVRAAYGIAPCGGSDLLERMHALAPSWPLGAHGVALLQSWATVDAHRWLRECRATLRCWKARQTSLLRDAGWKVEPGTANFFVATREKIAAECAHEGTFESGVDMKSCLDTIRRQGFKLRDCASFGLPNHVRMAVVAPAVQDALLRALKSGGLAGKPVVSWCWAPAAARARAGLPRRCAAITPARGSRWRRSRRRT